MISCQHSQKSRSIGNQLIACSDYLGTVKTSFLKGTSSISDEAELPDFARGDLGPWSNVSDRCRSDYCAECFRYLQSGQGSQGLFELTLGPSIHLCSVWLQYEHRLACEEAIGVIGVMESTSIGFQTYGVLRTSFLSFLASSSARIVWAATDLQLFLCWASLVEVWANWAKKTSEVSQCF